MPYFYVLLEQFAASYDQGVTSFSVWPFRHTVVQVIVFTDHARWVLLTECVVYLEQRKRGQEEM